MKEILEKYRLKDKPSQLHNCDESGMPLPKIIAIKGRQITSGKTQILSSVSAAGKTMPPMVVFTGKKFQSRVEYGRSTWNSLWNVRLRLDGPAHFLKHAVSNRPILLLLDGHSSHYTLKLCSRAQSSDFLLPTTHDS